MRDMYHSRCEHALLAVTLCFSLFLSLFCCFTDPPFAQGTSVDQDNRFGNKQKLLLKKVVFPAELDKKVGDVFSWFLGLMF